MKFDITKLSEQELFEHLEKLDECEMIDLKMDGSGELGHIISEGYDKSRQKVYDEIERRGVEIWHTPLIMMGMMNFLTSKLIK